MNYDVLLNNMTPENLKNISAVGALNGLIGVLGAAPIFIAGFVMWKMTDAPSREDYDDSFYKENLAPLESKIGETYTVEMHQKVSKVIKSGDESAFTILESLEKCMRFMLMYGLVLFGVALVNKHYLKKLLRDPDKAEQVGAPDRYPPRS